MFYLVLQSLNAWGNGSLLNTMFFNKANFAPAINIKIRSSAIIYRKNSSAHSIFIPTKNISTSVNVFK